MLTMTLQMEKNVVESVKTSLTFSLFIVSKEPEITSVKLCWVAVS